jgi:acyl carrier protein
MNEGLTASRVRKVLEIVFEREFSIEDPIRRTDQAEWDSLKHISVIFGLEDEFSIRIDEDEMDELIDKDSIVRLVERHLQ